MPSTQVIGKVTALDAQSGQISLKTDKGEAVTALVAASTVYLRVPPDEKDLQKAARIAFSDIGMGDRVLVQHQAQTANHCHPEHTTAPPMRVALSMTRIPGEVTVAKC